MNLAELKATPIGGNAYLDNHIFQKVDKFVFNNNNTIHDRARALQWMSTEVMGCSLECDEGLTDENIVDQYIQGC